MQNFLSGASSEKPKPPPQTQPVAPQVASTSTVPSLIGPTAAAPSTVVDTTAAAALADCADGATPTSQDDAAAQQLLLPLKPVMPESQGHAATAAEPAPTAAETAPAPTTAAPTPPATAECDVISTKMQDVAAVENNAD